MMIVPAIGQLNRRIRLVSVSDVPAGSSELAEQRKTIASVWAHCEVVGGTSYYQAVNTEEAVTHRFFVRYVDRLTRPQDLRHLSEVECENVFYRVKRCTDVNNAHRFTLMECEELSCGDSEIFS